MRKRAAGGLSVIIAIAILVAGCSSPAVSDTDTPALSLSGPWASQFQTGYATAKSAYERGVLRDGVVTPVEYEQTRSRVRSCLEDSGYTIIWDERGGFRLGSQTDSYPDDFFEESDPILQKCESSWAGSILFLFEQVRRNPDKKDEATIQVACLKSAGLVDATYNKQRWNRDNENDDFPYDASSEDALRCGIDPLALWYTK